MDITDRSDKKLTVVDLNNLVLKDNIFVYSGMVVTYSGTTSASQEVKVLVSITEGSFFMNETEHFFAAVTSEAVTQAIATNGTYYLWIGIDSTDSIISYLTDTYVSPTYTEESELLVNCLKVTVTGTYTTTIDETIDLKIVNNYYGQGVESGLLDSFMKNNIKIVEQQAENTLTPTSFEDMVIDTFSDTTGYLNTVVTGSTTAGFDVNKYERNSSVGSPTGGVKTVDGLYTIHEFKTNGEFKVYNSGNVEYLIVAGGGSGGWHHGGGGGAGGIVYDSSNAVTEQTYNIIVGAGGPSPGIDDRAGINGGDSTAFGSVSSGGGGGGYYSNNSGLDGGSSGGGGGYTGSAGTKNQDAHTASSGTRISYSNNGSARTGSSSNTGGNGGGAGGAGTSTVGGAGHFFTNFSSFGTSGYFGGGGGAGNDGTGQLGSNGGGNGGAGGGGTGTSGTDYTGSGGGGGGGSSGDGAAGGSGIVLIRYLTTDFPGVTSSDDEITCLITGVTIAKTHCQLYINQIDNEPDCEITYDIISADAESDTDIAVNSYHEITSFTPTVAKLTGATIVIHLKNDAVAPTSGYPSMKSYVLKLW